MRQVASDNDGRLSVGTHVVLGPHRVTADNDAWSYTLRGDRLRSGVRRARIDLWRIIWPWPAKWFPAGIAAYAQVEHNYPCGCWEATVGLFPFGRRIWVKLGDHDPEVERANKNVLTG